MIGKLIEIHPEDAYYPNATDFIGTVWEFNGHIRESGLAGYFMGAGC